jgi:hypothetical protein
MPDILVEESVILTDSTEGNRIIILSESISLTESVLYEIVPEYDYYGTINEADRYFSAMLHGELWSKTTYDRKRRSLITATQKINTLRFAGVKTEEDQLLEFPRGGETEVPLSIKKACFEIALSLLKGISSETEYDNLFVRSRKFGQIQTDYDNSGVPEYKVSGIPSLTAWNYLYPYLKPALDLRLRRG